ncbi:MAG: GNAT family N-acetyltransferase [Ktedonobacteraceae bacterium]|nr:GNAT family N-acetyltransferase [Ktedonobacteraceae bacterium]
MLVRSIVASDAEQFLDLCLQLDKETQFMLLEPGERATTVVQQQAQIERILSQDNQHIFVAEDDGLLVGYLGAFGEHFKRSKHRVYIVVGILRAFSGHGLGTRLFREMEIWARQRHLHRLELTVITHNTAAVALYKKQGFEIEGLRKHALYVNGAYTDEYYMTKLLD